MLPSPLPPEQNGAIDSPGISRRSNRGAHDSRALDEGQLGLTDRPASASSAGGAGQANI